MRRSPLSSSSCTFTSYSWRWTISTRTAKLSTLVGPSNFLDFGHLSPRKSAHSLPELTNSLSEDLKLENIMVTFEDTAVLSEFLNSQLERGTQYKLDSSGRAIYPHQKVFGALRNVGNIPQIVDFGPSTRLDEEDLHGVYPIQPDHYRAPEVILGCGWQMSADIWNFGVIVGSSHSVSKSPFTFADIADIGNQLWDLIHGKELFRNVHDAQGNYDAKSHLAEMIALLGPPPVKLIKRHQSRTEVGWKSFITRMNGKRCANANDFFDGPFFDQDGTYTYTSRVITT